VQIVTCIVVGESRDSAFGVLEMERDLASDPMMLIPDTAILAPQKVRLR